MGERLRRPEVHAVRRRGRRSRGRRSGGLLAHAHELARRDWPDRTTPGSWASRRCGRRPGAPAPVARSARPCSRGASRPGTTRQSRTGGPRTCCPPGPGPGWATASRSCACTGWSGTDDTSRTTVGAAQAVVRTLVPLSYDSMIARASSSARRPAGAGTGGGRPSTNAGSRSSRCRSNVAWKSRSRSLK